MIVRQGSHWGMQVKCASAADGAFGSDGGGIVKDQLDRSVPQLATDLTDGLYPKAFNATVYMIFASLAPCFAFGGMVSRVTASQMGLRETILSCAVSGLIYTLLAAQPLTLLGPTGFMVMITGDLYRLTKQVMVPFLPVYGWVGIWSCIFLFGLAAVEASSEFAKYLTRFVDETFTTFISIGFMCEAYKLMRTRRPFVATIFDGSSNEIFKVRRPAWFINSSIYVEVDGKVIGECHLWRRIYDVYLGELQACTAPAALILWRPPCCRLFWPLEPMQLPKCSLRCERHCCWCGQCRAWLLISEFRERSCSCPWCHFASSQR